MALLVVEELIVSRRAAAQVDGQAAATDLRAAIGPGADDRPNLAGKRLIDPDFRYARRGKGSGIRNATLERRTL